MLTVKKFCMISSQFLVTVVNIDQLPSFIYSICDNNFILLMQILKGKLILYVLTKIFSGAIVYVCFTQHRHHSLNITSRE